MLANWLKRLDAAIIAKKTAVCCGLDPDRAKLPSEYDGLAGADAILEFLLQVVDVTISDVAAYKIQKAYFERWPEGHNVLRELIAHIRRRDDRVVVIVDAKLGDISNTMEAYFESYLDVLDADAVVLNPYMGADVWRGLRTRVDRGAVVLVRTSNELASAIQDLQLVSGAPVWSAVLKMVLEEWAISANLMPVLAATSDVEVLRSARAMIPDEMPIFVAGVGAQGGPVAAVRHAVNSESRGILVNSSRALLYPYLRDDRLWRDRIALAATEFRVVLNAAVQ